MATTETKRPRRLLAGGVVLALIVVIFLVAYWLPKVRADRLVAGPAAVQSFYELAKEQEYRTADASPEVKKTVAEWDRSSGPVLMFQPAERRVGFLGRPVEVDVKVVRRRGKFLETCVLGDGQSVSEIKRSPLQESLTGRSRR